MIFVKGLTAVISVKVAEPQFEVKQKQSSAIAKPNRQLRLLVGEKLAEQLEENPAIGKKIIEKCMRAAESPRGCKKARDLTRKEKCFRQYDPSWQTCRLLNHRS